MSSKKALNFTDEEYALTNYLMTPEEAADILKHRNTKNRPLSEERAEAIADDIKKGLYINDGTVISFDINGTLVNGQTRLRGIVLSKQAVRVDLRFGLPVVAFLTNDIGKTRTGGDIVHIAGYQKSNPLNAALSLIWAFQQKDPSVKSNTLQHARRRGRDNLQLMADGVNANDVYESLLMGNKVRKMMPTALASALHYSFALKDKAKAEMFFILLGNGENLSLGNPVLALRKKLIDMKRESLKKRIQFDKREYAFYMITAWNRIRSGRQMVNVPTWSAQKGVLIPEIS